MCTHHTHTHTDRQTDRHTQHTHTHINTHTHTRTPSVFVGLAVVVLESLKHLWLNLDGLRRAYRLVFLGARHVLRATTWRVAAIRVCVSGTVTCHVSTPSPSLLPRLRTSSSRTNQRSKLQARGFMIKIIFPGVESQWKELSPWKFQKRRRSFDIFF